MLVSPELPLWTKLPSLAFCSGDSSPLSPESPPPFGVFPEVSSELSPPFGGCCGVSVESCPGVLGEGGCTVPFGFVSLSTPWITIFLGLFDHTSI